MFFYSGTLFSGCPDESIEHDEKMELIRIGSGTQHYVMQLANKLVDF